METCYLSAQAFSGADLLHGPLATVDAQVPVLAIVSEGASGRAMLPVLSRLAERRADIVVVGAGPAPQHLAGRIALPGGIPEELSPLLEILPLQQLSLQLAIARGEDPDNPRGLHKVTQDTVTLISAGTMVLGGRICRPGWLQTSGRQILECGAGVPPRPADVDFPDSVVVPGFIDMHVHGGGGPPTPSWRHRTSPEPRSSTCGTAPPPRWPAWSPPHPRNCLPACEHWPRRPGKASSRASTWRGRG